MLSWGIGASRVRGGGANVRSPKRGPKRLAIGVATLAVACAAGQAKPAPPIAEVHESIERCKDIECRLPRYAELFRGGANLLSEIRDAEVPCGAFAEPGCPSMPWCLSLMQGTYQFDFLEQLDVLWLGRDAGAVRKITTASERTVTVDGSMMDADVSTDAARLGVARITLSRDAERWREVPAIGLLATRRVQDVVAIEACAVVYADACAGRIGYVCTGGPWWNGVGRGGLITVELDLESPPTRHVSVRGRAVPLD